MVNQRQKLCRGVECLPVDMYSKCFWSLVEIYQEGQHTLDLIRVIFVYRRRFDRLAEQFSMHAPAWSVTHGSQAPLRKKHVSDTT